jgi:hypothetical protein
VEDQVSCASMQGLPEFYQGCGPCVTELSGLGFVQQAVFRFSLPRHVQRGRTLTQCRGWHPYRSVWWSCMHACECHCHGPPALHL